MGGFDSISYNEVIIAILSYLRAVDLASVSEVNKTIFSRQRISIAIQALMSRNQPAAILTPYKKQFSVTSQVYRPDSLYVFEVTSILNAILAAPPPTGKGYWISSAWVSNAKKYFEALNLPEIDISNNNSKKGTPKKKAARIRQRRGSESLPPWPIVNCDLVCSHDHLALSKAPNARRKAIDTRSWFMIRKYYPFGPEYKCSSAECSKCTMEQNISLQSLQEKREMEMEQRRVDLAPSSLTSLFERKQGVPEHCTYRIDEEEPIFSLRSGLYNLVPRDWLRQWRRYVKDLTVSSLPALDCTRLVCYSHGLLVLPPHLEEYMVGARRSLLGGLGTYEGEIVELVSAEEWDELQRVNKGMTDFGVRFCLDEGNISWNVGVCRACDPFSYATSANNNRELLGKANGGLRARNIALGVI